MRKRVAIPSQAPRGISIPLLCFMAVLAMALSGYTGLVHNNISFSSDQASREILRVPLDSEDIFYRWNLPIMLRVRLARDNSGQGRDWVEGVGQAIPV